MVIAIVGLVSTAACSESSGSPSASEAPAATNAPGGTDMPGSSVPITDIDDLARGGVGVIASEADLTTVRPGAIVLVEASAQRLLAEVDAGGGIPGADLDAFVPLPADAPPLSYFLAAWVATDEGAAAEVSRSWMGEQDWSRAPDIVFPQAVVALFVTDALTHIDAELPTAPAGLRGAAASALGWGGPALSGGASLRQDVGDLPVCSSVTDFLGKTLTAIFDALRLTTDSFEGLPPLVSAVAGFLAGLWNTAVSFAEGVVTGLATALTAPIVQALQFGIGVLAVATQVLSFVKNWELVVTLNPPVVDTDTYRFAVGSEPDITGEFVALAPDLTASWPRSLVDCAAVAGVALPQLLAPGGAARWVIEENQGVVATGPLQTTVRADRSIRLPFTTGRESVETAAGEPQFGSAIARAYAPRKELQDLLDLARYQIEAVTDQILARLPHPDMRTAVRAEIDPLLGQFVSDARDAVGDLVTLSGVGVVIVKFHTPPKPEPDPETKPGTNPGIPPPETGPKPDEFCRLNREMMEWTRENSATWDRLANVAAYYETRLESWLPRLAAAAPDTLRFAINVYFEKDSTTVAYYRALFAQDPSWPDLSEQANAIDTTAADDSIAAYCGPMMLGD